VENVMATAPRSLAAESYRRLANKLAKGAEESQVLVVTSSIPDEGKTSVAMNLAQAFAADAAGETLIVDADLRRPSVHKWLKQPPGLGLTEVLSGKVGLEHAVHGLKDSSLRVLPAGTPCRDPLELLGSSRARETIQTLRQFYRRVVIDTPPIVLFTDADAVAKLADGILLVARCGLTPRKSYEEAIGLLNSGPILGVVLNQYSRNIADGPLDRGSYYSSYYKRGPYE
jgi:receptor protein-tyrosine kinase/non-specific protein-tyrosine kinase